MTTFFVMPTDVEKGLYVAELLFKQVKHQLTPEEETILIAWRNSSFENYQVWEKMSDWESLLEALRELYQFEGKNRYPDLLNNME